MSSPPGVVCRICRTPLTMAFVPVPAPSQGLTLHVLSKGVAKDNDVNAVARAKNATNRLLNFMTEPATVDLKA